MLAGGDCSRDMEGEEAFLGIGGRSKLSGFERKIDDSLLAMAALGNCLEG